MPEPMSRLDGNAAAGVLEEAFAAEMTAARIGCGACGSTWWIGQCHVYADAPGTVVRCCGCHAILVTVVRTPRGICVDLIGSLPTGELR